MTKKKRLLSLSLMSLIILTTSSCSSFLGSNVDSVEEELRTIYVDAVNNGYFKNYESFIDDFFSNPNTPSKVKEINLTKIAGTHKIYTYTTLNGYKGTSDIRLGTFGNLEGYHLYRHLVPNYSKSESEWSYELHSNLLAQPTKRMLDINYGTDSYKNTTKYVELGTNFSLLQLNGDPENDIYFVTYIDTKGDRFKSSILFNKNTYLEAYYEPAVLNATIVNKDELQATWKINDSERRIDINLLSNKYSNVITALTVGSLKLTSSDFNVISFNGQNIKAMSEGNARVSLLTKNNKVLDFVDIKVGV